MFPFDDVIMKFSWTSRFVNDKSVLMQVDWYIILQSNMASGVHDDLANLNTN